MSSSESSSDESESWDFFPWDETLKHRIKENDPRVKSIEPYGEDIQNMTDEECEELGRDIANNTHLKKIDLSFERINDHTMACLFRGLTRSSSIKELNMYRNELSSAGVRSMVPFLQNASKLLDLDLSENNLQSGGFHLLWGALRNSPIEELSCVACDITSIEFFDSPIFPCNLTALDLGYNGINADGCRELAKLLQGGDATLERLDLQCNKIDDDGVKILVGALRNNTSLRRLDLYLNDAISSDGQTMLLKLVNDISSIDATLRSNHTLEYLHGMNGQIQMDIDNRLYLSVEPITEQIQTLIDAATTGINSNAGSPEAAGRAKVIQTQLHSERRAELAELQGVHQSIYSEIDSLLLPEVIALVGRHHGQGELYLVLKSSIAGVISTVQQEGKHSARKGLLFSQSGAPFSQSKGAVDAELAAIEEVEES